jgi:hypothetical protein
VEPPPGLPAKVSPGVGPPRGGALSSAILYLAIVAIWAGVLIPRWLRRDNSAGEQVPETDGVPEMEDFSSEDSSAEEEPAPAPQRREMLRAQPRPGVRSDAWADARSDLRSAVRADSRSGVRADSRSDVRADSRSQVRAEARSDVRADSRADVRPDVRAEVRDEVPSEPRSAADREAEHKRVVTARRRLLWMLLALTLGSVELAVTKLAAWWVIVPPTVMLACYLLILREGAKADAERRELERAREARMAARSAPETPPVVEEPVVPPVRVPDAEVIEMPAARGEQLFDQYADAKLRAVGD